MVATNVRGSVARTLRRSFFSGLLVVVPVVITVYILIVLFHFTDSLLVPLIGRFTSTYIPGLGIVATVLLIFVVGLITQNYVAQRLLGLADQLLAQIPLAGSIYGAIKQILNAFAPGQAEEPKAVVMIPYPSRGLWAFGFLNGTITLQEGQRMGLVLLLNSINPTTGLLTMLPMEQIVRVPLSVEEAMKLIISGGIVNPRQLGGEPLLTSP
ncbi:MAG: DUF502 domain-containing protein [Acidobacteria bacterium]|nr:DUF502 domain-containing protein [Acidobacteriota bacterium]